MLAGIGAVLILEQIPHCSSAFRSSTAWASSSRYLDHDAREVIDELLEGARPRDITVVTHGLEGR